MEIRDGIISLSIIHAKQNAHARTIGEREIQQYVNKSSNRADKAKQRNKHKRVSFIDLSHI